MEALVQAAQVTLQSADANWFLKERVRMLVMWTCREWLHQSEPLASSHLNPDIFKKIIYPAAAVSWFTNAHSRVESRRRTASSACVASTASYILLSGVDEEGLKEA